MTLPTTSDDKDHLGMKRFLAPLAAVAVAAVTTSTLLVGLSAASSATAASAKPPWEPDHHSKGGLLFYNSKGKKITSGKLTAAPFAAYVQGAVPVRKGDTKATLFAYLPKKGQVPGQFTGEQLTTSDSYPNSKAPSALRKSALPLVSLTKNDETLGELFADFPNPAKSGNAYSGLYELRLITSKAGSTAATAYDSADIAVSNVTTSNTGTVTGGTWKLRLQHGQPDRHPHDAQGVAEALGHQGSQGDAAGSGHSQGCRHGELQERLEAAQEGQGQGRESEVCDEEAQEGHPQAARGLHADVEAVRLLDVEDREAKGQKVGTSGETTN